MDFFFNFIAINEINSIAIIYLFDHVWESNTFIFTFA